MGYKQDMKRAFMLYERELGRIAELKFETIVYPYLRRHGYDFSSGYETGWVMWESPLHRISVEVERIPKRVREVLDEPVPGLHNVSLALFMPSWLNGEKRRSRYLPSK